MKLKYILFVLFALFIFFSLSNCSITFDDEKATNVDNRVEEVQNQQQTTESSGLPIWQTILVILAAIIFGGGTVLFFTIMVPLRLWYSAWLSGIRISWIKLIFLRWKGIPRTLVTKLVIKAKNAGIELDISDLGKYHLAGVDVDKVVNDLIVVKNAGIDVTLDQIAKQSLANVDVDKVASTLVMAKNAKIITDFQSLCSYHLAKLDVERLIKAKIAAQNSEFDISLDELREHYASGGHFEEALKAYIAAKKANLEEITFKDIAAIDLAGYDVTKSVNSCIDAKVVETGGVSGYARDGIQLTMKVKLTLRAQLRSIIGGLSYDTVSAKVNEGIITEIGLTNTHYQVLESPYELADRVEKRNLDEGSGFRILSIDVSDIVIGKDIHAELKRERAKAEAEMAKAEFIKAEREVQKAIAAAFLDGKLSIHEYHQMVNTEADTKMREALGKNLGQQNKELNQHKDDSAHH